MHSYTCGCDLGIALLPSGTATGSVFDLTILGTPHKAEVIAETHNPRHFKLLRDGELDQLPALQWLVKRIIPDKGIGAIYGDSGTFKSFLALDLLAHI